MSEDAELNDNELSGVNGGFLFENDNGAWEVISDTNGDVLAVFDDYDDADEFAFDHGISQVPVGWWKVNELRCGTN